MKKYLAASLSVVLMVPIVTLAAKSGAQVGAQQDQVRNEETSPNELAGDGIPNNTQEGEYGEYGAGESPNELSGDGIPNATQGEEYGKYGTTDATIGSTSANTERVQVRAQNGAQLSGSLEQVRTQVRAERGAEAGTRTQVRADRENAEVALRMLEVAGPLFGEQEARVRALTARVAEQNERALVAEVKARDRGAIARFFMGGDRAAAKEIEEVAMKNRESIREMQELLEGCTSCDEMTRETVRTQIGMLLSEQERLTERATAERARTGLLGWLFK